MTNPLVSVIVPTYNQSSLLPHTLKSIFIQNYEPLEILVCDDGSTDDTEQMVDRIGSKAIRYIKLEHGGIPARTMNAGLKEAKGEIIMFLDGDDQFLPGKISRQVDHFLKHPECDLLFGDGFYVVSADGSYMDPDSSSDETFFQQNPPPKDITFLSLAPKTYVAPCTAAFRRRVVEGKIRCDESYMIVWDWEFFLQALKEGFRMDMITDRLSAYRRHKKNITSPPKSLIKLIEEEIRMFGSYRELIPPDIYFQRVERWRYEWMKQSIKFCYVESLPDIRSSGYMPESLPWRLKTAYYFFYRKLFPHRGG